MKFLGSALAVLSLGTAARAQSCPGFQTSGSFAGYPSQSAADECVYTECGKKCTETGLICSDPDLYSWVSYDCKDRKGNFYAFDDYGAPYTDECLHADPCVHGYCEDTNVYKLNTVTCKCENNWYGANCDQINECEMGIIICKNLQPCREPSVAVDGDAFCDCGPGYSGELCEENDECITKPTKNPNCGGHSHCKDPDLWEPSVLECACDDNWFGPSCTYTDECLTNPAYANWCGEYGVCVDSIPESANIMHISCDCSQHPGISGNKCEIENECVSGRKLCLNGATCLDPDQVILNDAYCSCRTGFSGAECEKENECLSGGWSCEHGGECDDPDFLKDQSARCVCPEGYSGKRCELIDECLVGASPCEAWEVCTDLDLKTVDGEVTCGCAPGFSGFKCLLEDECILDPLWADCSDHGICTDENLKELNTSFCDCEPAYFGDKCQYHDECEDDITAPNCGPKGQCIDFDLVADGSSLGCKCSPGWGGPTCDELRPCYTEHQECDSDPNCSLCMYEPYDESKGTTLDMLFDSVIAHEALYMDCADYNQALDSTIMGPIESKGYVCDSSIPGPLSRLMECRKAQCTLDWQCSSEFTRCNQDDVCSTCIEGIPDPTISYDTTCSSMSEIVKRHYTTGYECNAILGNPPALKDLVECTIREKEANKKCVGASELGTRSGAGQAHVGLLSLLAGIGIAAFNLV